MKRISIVVSGLVQGVGFRWHSRQQAEALGLTGMVRNTRDNTVEIEVQGNEAAVNGFIEWARKGAPNAQVDAVHVAEILTVQDETRFRIVK